MPYYQCTHFGSCVNADEGLTVQLDASMHDPVCTSCGVALIEVTRPGTNARPEDSGSTASEVAAKKPRKHKFDIFMIVVTLASVLTYFLTRPSGPPSVKFDGPMQAAAVVGERFVFQVPVSPSQSSLSATDLPPGFVLENGQIIASNPLQSGEYFVSLRGEHGPSVTEAKLRLVIAPRPLSITITSLNPPEATVDKPYKFKITTSVPSTAPLAVQDLPVGLRLQGDEIQGTPTIAQTTMTKVTASNNAGSDSKYLTFTVVEQGSGISLERVRTALVGFESQAEDAARLTSSISRLEAVIGPLQGMAPGVGDPNLPNAPQKLLANYREQLAATKLKLNAAGNGLVVHFRTIKAQPLADFTRVCAEWPGTPPNKAREKIIAFLATYRNADLTPAELLQNLEELYTLPK